jgi:hypothetical protein
MIEQKFAIYNFMAKKLDCVIYDSVDKFKAALDSSALDKRCVAKKWYDVFDIDKQENIAQVYLARDSFEIFKLVNNEITEHYQKTIKNNWLYIAYDLVTGDPIEYYVVDGDNLNKYDFVTHEKTGFTTDSSWENLPEYFKNRLDKTKYSNKIMYWAEKPYGNVIGVTP